MERCAMFNLMNQTINCTFIKFWRITNSCMHQCESWKRRPKQWPTMQSNDTNTDPTMHQCKHCSHNSNFPTSHILSYKAFMKHKLLILMNWFFTSTGSDIALFIHSSWWIDFHFYQVSMKLNYSSYDWLQAHAFSAKMSKNTSMFCTV